MFWRKFNSTSSRIFFRNLRYIIIVKFHQKKLFIITWILHQINMWNLKLVKLKVTGCLSVPRYPANCWSDLTLLYSEAFFRSLEGICPTFLGYSFIEKNPSPHMFSFIFLCLSLIVVSLCCSVSICRIWSETGGKKSFGKWFFFFSSQFKFFIQ